MKNNLKVYSLSSALAIMLLVSLPVFFHKPGPYICSWAQCDSKCHIINIARQQKNWKLYCQTEGYGTDCMTKRGPKDQSGNLTNWADDCGN